MSDFVEAATECSKHVDVTDNRRHRKKIIKDSQEEHNDGSLTNYNLNNFSGNKGAVAEEQHITGVVLSNKIDQQKSKLEIPAKDSFLFSENSRSNLIDQKRQKEVSCDLIENGTLCNTSREMTLFEDDEENIVKLTRV